MFYYGAECVVEVYFVVKIIETSAIDKVSIYVWFVNFRNEDDIWKIFFDVTYCPIPEFYRHHFCHIAAETVYSEFCPI